MPDTTSLPFPGKLRPPELPPHLVPRARLLARLESAFKPGGRLILVAAPPGAGKTTLLAQWLAAHPRPYAWLSIDDADNDPLNFWHGLASALAQAKPAGAAALRAQLAHAPLPPAAALLAVLLAAWAEAGEPGLLVLDDYHLIRAEAVHAAVRLLADQLPPAWRLALGTRADPPLGMARRRARGQLIELRAAQLQFEAPETEQYLNRGFDLGLGEDEIAQLQARTEGWAAGLQLAALALQATLGSTSDAAGVEGVRRQFVEGFGGGDRYLTDYLFEELLAHQPAERVAFLLQTSILRRLSAPLCMAVTGCPDAADELAALESQHLFVVALDRQHAWRRYHTLFADLLQQQLRQAYSAEHIIGLHRRAAGWYADQGLLEDAITHALAAPDVGQAADLLQVYFHQQREQSGRPVPLAWLRALPAELTAARPTLCLAYAEAIAKEPSPAAVEEAETWLDRAAMNASGAALPDALVAGIHQQRVMLAAYRGQSPAEIQQAAQRALQQIPANFPGERGAVLAYAALSQLVENKFEAAEIGLREAQRLGQQGGQPRTVAEAAFLEAGAALHQGRLQTALSVCDRVLADVAVEETPVAAGLLLVRGLVLAERDEREAARQALTTAMRLVPLAGEWGMEMAARLALARLQTLDGDTTGALGLIEQAALLERAWTGGTRLCDTHRCRVWLSQAASEPGALARAAEWVRQYPDVVDAPSNPPAFTSARRQQIFELVTLARYAAAAARQAHPLPAGLEPEAMVKRLQAQQAACHEAGARLWALELGVLGALLLAETGQPPTDALRAALGQAAPENVRRPFLDQGPVLMRLLAEASGDHPFVRALYHHAGMAENGLTPAVGDRSAPVLAEPLSAREREVLALMATGLTNDEICARLVISKNTLKKHIGRVFAKLEASHRAQAVARARELGLIAP